MKTFLITYFDGGTVTAKGYNIFQALGAISGHDFIKKIEQI